MKVITLLASILTINVFAAIPSLEGLLRNSSNKELDKQLVVAHVVVKRVGADEEFSTSENLVTNYFKYMFITSESEKDYKKSLVIRYDDPTYSVSGVSNVKAFDNVEKLLGRDMTKDILQSSILSYTYNSSLGFNKVFKAIEPNYKSNSDLINKEKASLIEDYKNFLVKKKEYEKKAKEYEESVGEAPISPLESDNDQKQAELKSIMSSSLYKGSNNLKLEKRNREFVWSIKLDNIKGEFKNENHQLIYLDLSTDNGNYTIVPKSFVTYNGQYTLPKYIEITTSDYRYQIEIPTYYLLNSTNKSIADRTREYMRYLERNKQRKGTQVNVEGQEIEADINLLF
ncbi:hypothetical protein M902_1551 [Bacteriovorax sp. BAL6_X]|uniref:hypothetical protein n=1 Tax=Bacteriovorax sp. BAL6_X TaxID=1201290 RepID=UPI00038667F8|nr:hypothetical protein [Bacteriovorax sp. BAL6_X]EPZ50445.1 hypothetical protein M902_1551 [Bacteriovorax sp. BAL6_X]